MSVSHVQQPRLDASLHCMVLLLNSAETSAVVGWCTQQCVTKHLIHVRPHLGDEAGTVVPQNFQHPSWEAKVLDPASDECVAPVHHCRVDHWDHLQESHCPTQDGEEVPVPLRLQEWANYVDLKIREQRLPDQLRLQGGGWMGRPILTSWKRMHVMAHAATAFVQCWPEVTLVDSTGCLRWRWVIQIVQGLHDQLSVDLGAH